MSNSERERMEAALRFLVEHRAEQPDLAAAATHVGLSLYHFQRTFSRWVGVSPKRFLQYLTAGDAGELLRRRAPVLEVSHAVGLSGGSRLHDLFLSVHGMTPAEYRSRGETLLIRWGGADTPFGVAVVGVTGQGICWLSFHDSTDIDSGVEEMRREWARAHFERADSDIANLVDGIFGDLNRPRPVHLLVKGTNFQLRVWEALLRIPGGATATYGDIARAIGRPTAGRAVGTAIGANLVSWLIPCHRVIRGDGIVGGYRWGSHRKCMMLAREASDAGSFDDPIPPTATDIANEQAAAGR